jgi:hypothetical protein
VVLRGYRVEKLLMYFIMSSYSWSRADSIGAAKDLSVSFTSAGHTEEILVMKLCQLN